MAPTKRKAAALAADFKLGSNATDTSFKTRTIALPQQSVVIDRSQSVTTRRKQTVRDLVQNTRHPSSGVRRDAVQGLLELISHYPFLVAQETPVLVNTVLPLLGDDDASVRAAVDAYLKVLIDHIPLLQFLPYVSSILLFTTSAMSHITMPVRLDALRILTLLLDKTKQAVTVGWEGAVYRDWTSGDAHGQRVLQAFFAMLGVAGEAAATKQGSASTTAGATASVELQPRDRLRVFRTLAHFLRTATAVEKKTALPLWCFEAAFASSSELEQFAHLFSGPQPVYTPGMPWIEPSRVAIGTSAESVCDALLAGAAIHQATQADVSAYERLAQLLHAPLLATLLDALPSALAPEGTSTQVHLELVTEILAIAAALWRSIVTDHIATNAARDMSATIRTLPQLQQLLSHLAPYFPVQPERAYDAHLRLNAVYCELVALCAIGQGAHERSAAQRKNRAQLSVYMDHTMTYLAALLEDTSVEWTPELYHALVPTFWLLLTVPHADATLMEALLRHYAALPTSSPLKPLAFEFLARLAQLHTYATLRISLEAVHTPHGAWNAWLLSLPRTLWEAVTHAVARSKGTPETRQTHLALATSILHLLLNVLVQADGVVFTQTTLDALSSPLRTLYTVEHPTKGAIPGPYHRLPAAAKAQARALAQRGAWAADSVHVTGYDDDATVPHV